MTVEPDGWAIYWPNRGYLNRGGGIGPRAKCRVFATAAHAESSARKKRGGHQVVPIYMLTHDIPDLAGLAAALRADGYPEMAAKLAYLAGYACQIGKDQLAPGGGLDGL